PQYWVSVIGYGFSSAEMSEADRLLNPLGFQVTSYRRDAETLPEAVSPPAMTGPVGQAGGAR
ncbi:MAG: type IV secretion system protein, partial [Gammaproteobacteria bacterium]